MGVDLAWPYLRRVEGGDASVRVLRANAENLPFRDELDAIVASDVLEHVLNPADFLHSALEALRPGGRLLLKVPYRENISQYRRADGCPYPMVHLRTFDRSAAAPGDRGRRAARRALQLLRLLPRPLAPGDRAAAGGAGPAQEPPEAALR